MKCILAYDMGGTSLRAGLVTLTGEFLCGRSLTLAPLPMDSEGRSEFDPSGLWVNFLEATGALLESPGATGAEIVALTLAGFTRAQIFLDDRGKSVRKALTWADGRAAKQAEHIVRAQRRLGDPSKIFGPVNAFHTLARLLWVQENEPDRFERIATVLEPKDYINFLLTGEIAGDRISHSRILSVSGRTLCSVLLKEIGLPDGLFPPLRNPWDRLGSVRSGLAAPMDRLAGAPVFIGGMDAWCGGLGIGAVRVGRGFNASGTSEVFGAAMEDYREITGLVTLPWSEKLFFIGGPSQAGADCLTWCLQATSEKEEQDLGPGAMLAQSQTVNRQKEPILFLPYLRGERAPLWDPNARGLFLGLNRRHRRVDLIWAVLEGIGFSNRQILELVAKQGGATIEEVRITGGAAQSDLWCQVKADILKLPVVRTREKEGGVLGAAMVALIGLGYGDMAHCQERFVGVDRVFEPRPERTGFYDRMFRRWMEAQGALLPLTREMTRDVHEGFAAAPQ